MKLLIWLPVFLWCLLGHGSFGVDTDRLSVMEGGPVTLYTGVQTNKQDIIIWYYNDILIAQINRDLSDICTDVQFKGGDERFRDRLELDHETGSLIIRNTRNTDAGKYTLKISSSSSRISEQTFIVSVTGVHKDGVSVMEGDQIPLNTGVQTNKQDRIIWYYNGNRIGQISGDFSCICENDLCKEKFGDRLKLDHQTGSLTISDTIKTDFGEYKVKISSSRVSEKTFSVFVSGVSGVDTERVSVMVGDSVTLNTGVQTNKQDRIVWYHNEICIAQINGDFSYYCKDVQCNKDTERFRDRLKLDYHTGSLIIMNTRNTDSGQYQLQVISSGVSEKIFIVSVTGSGFAAPDSGLSSAAVGGICVALAVLLVVAAVIYSRHR